MGYVVFRKMVEPDGFTMRGYLTPFNEWGVRREAWVFDTYEEAEEEYYEAQEYFGQNFPEDINDFDILEVDD